MDTRDTGKTRSGVLRLMLAGFLMLCAASGSNQAPFFSVLAAIGAAVLIGIEAWRRDWAYRAGQFVLRQLVFAYLRIDVRGLEHIPSRGPAIIAANHPNVLDGLLLLVVAKRRVRFLVIDEFYSHPFLNSLFRLTGCIPVYRRATSNGDALRAAVAALERGEAIGIFPEGTTGDAGTMRRIKPGVALLALRTGAPIVPLGIRGTAEAYPRTQTIPRPSWIGMRFASPLRFARVDAVTVPEPLLGNTMETIRGEIIATRDRIVERSAAMGGLRWLRVALSAVVVWPLAHCLAVTASSGEAAPR